MKNLYLILVALVASLAMVSCDPCKKVDCNNGGDCLEGVCVCPDGYSGEYCDTVDLCIVDSVVCENGGECIDGECDCATFYYGENCTDHCVYGTYDAGACDCNQGIEGAACDTFSRVKFEGSYTFNSDFTSQVQASVIDAGEFENGDVWKVEMTNLSSQGDNDGYAEIDGDRIYVPEQTVSAQGNVQYTVKSISDGTYTNNGTTVKFTIRMWRLSNVQGSQPEEGDYKFSRPAN